MIFRWLKRRRRAKLLATPFPEAWRPALEALPFYEGLSDDERRRLDDILRVIVDEKHWEGLAGVDLDDEKKAIIAAQAALLILNIEHDYYKRVKTILVYPTAFESPMPRHQSGGIVSEGQRNAGEAWYRGPVILTWDGVRQGAADPKDGHNLVYHEFAHKLDMLDGYVDGTPPLHQRENYKLWRRVMSEEYQRLQDAARRGKRSVLDRYGATNEGEFFAVATETFFEQPVQLSRKHEELYALLKDYYRQDPLERLKAAT